MIMARMPRVMPMIADRCRDRSGLSGGGCTSDPIQVQCARVWTVCHVTTFIRHLHCNSYTTQSKCTGAYCTTHPTQLKSNEPTFVLCAILLDSSHFISHPNQSKCNVPMFVLCVMLRMHTVIHIQPNLLCTMHNAVHI